VPVLLSETGQPTSAVGTLGLLQSAKRTTLIKQAVQVRRKGTGTEASATENRCATKFPLENFKYFSAAASVPRIPRVF
jgi:hypothetical protein